MLPVKRSLLPTVSRFLDDNWTQLFDWSDQDLLGPNMTMPSVNIKETGDAYYVEMAAPGMKKGDFDIELDNNILTIKSEKKMEDELNEGEHYTRKEFSYQAFQRSFNLNKKIVDDAKINARYADGILSIMLPKKDEAKQKPARQIKIS
ncbi:MAG: Hsp20/alpha crystallin family protein [Saprospiraceae bacterium]|nr:Hsp20/alpha crystallin family protein [Saprospiraceae bacterium]